MSEELIAVQAVHFGGFELDTRTRELLKGGQRLKLEEKPFQVLELLLEKAGELVTRKELRERLWPDRYVSFDRGIYTAMNRLRKMLGDTTHSPRYIETRNRLGYRFIAPVGPADATVRPAPWAAPFNEKSTVKPVLIAVGGQESLPVVPFVTTANRTFDGDALRFQLQRPGGELTEISLRLTTTKEGGLNMRFDFSGARSARGRQIPVRSVAAKYARRTALGSQR